MSSISSDNLIPQFSSGVNDALIERVCLSNAGAVLSTVIVNVAVRFLNSLLISKFNIVLSNFALHHSFLSSSMVKLILANGASSVLLKRIHLPNWLLRKNEGKKGMLTLNWMVSGISIDDEGVIDSGISEVSAVILRSESKYIILKLWLSADALCADSCGQNEITRIKIISNGRIEIFLLILTPPIWIIIILGKVILL